MILAVTAAQIVTTVLAVVAIVVSVWTRLGAAKDAGRSRSAAERSAAASESSAATAERSAAASARSAAAAERVDQRQAHAVEDAAVSWRVVPDEAEPGQTYWLWNAGPQTAWHVSVHMSRTGSSRRDIAWGEWGLLTPGQRVPEPLQRGGRGPEAYVSVEWQLQDAPGRRIKRIYPLDPPPGA
jgi:hypothetical protein